MTENTHNNYIVREEESNIDIKKILNVVWGMRWYIVLSVFLCLLLAYAYNRVTRTRYTASSKIMLVTKGSNNADMIAVTDMITGGSNSKVANEVEILRSRTMMQKVVEELGLNYVFTKDRVVKTIYFYDNNPFDVLVDSTENFANPPQVKMTIIPEDENHFTIKSIRLKGAKYPFENRKYRFGEEIAIGGHNIAIVRTHLGNVEFGDKYSISMAPSYMTAKALTRNLTVASNSSRNYYDRNEVINLSYNDFLPKRAESIINWLVIKYNEDARYFSSRATSNTIEFLDERLGVIEEELGTIESRFQSYRRSNTVVDVASQSQMTLSTDAKYEEQLNAIDVQIELLSIIKDYVSSMDNGLTIIPANIGITDVGLNATINQFNTLLMERNRMLASSSESNPLVIQADNQLQDLLSSIVSSVRNLEKSYKLQHSNVNQKLREAKGRLSQVPIQQQEISSFERQRQIKEPLYILLQQKKEEAMISLYAISDQCKVVDDATNTAAPTSPNRKMIYLLALLLGLIIPPGLFFLRQALKSKVEGKLDITSRTDIPILASIPLNDKGSKLMEVTGRDPFEETMRILRSNVRYLGHKVFQVTSSVPGEGKSFISSNLAMTLAHTGLKVLIVGIDLRKPQLAKIFDIHQHHDEGLVPFLAGKTDDLSASIVHGVHGVPTLDVLPAGSIPPNPSELIESQRMKEAVDYLKSLGYDYILFDSAPYLPVADATIFNRYVDANIFMLRAGVCELRFVEDLDQLSHDDKMHNIYIVLNGVDIAARSYGYHYGYGYGHYGYGKNKYGYGYGYGYGDKKKVGLSEAVANAADKIKKKK